MKSPTLLTTLLLIVFAQFCCTSLWFAGNAVISDLVDTFNISQNAVGNLTSAVQFGFIVGTLLFAIYSIADRYAPSTVFFVSAVIGAIFNLAIIYKGNNFYSILGLRFLTGISLAGIYPVGMKIASDYFDKDLNKSLGYLVGALVLGTAFPHLLKGYNTALPWKYILYVTSAIAILGGLAIFLFIPNGPYRKIGKKIDFSLFFSVFKNRDVRIAAFGYFGHMWELYAFWAFVPVIITLYNEMHGMELNVAICSFAVIGVGSLSCAIGGYLAQRYGTKRMSIVFLASSGVCCFLLPFIITISSQWIFLLFLVLWGMVVIADSPLFSTLVAQAAEPSTRGTALTIVNCIGFSITIVSIQLLSYLATFSNSLGFMILGLGPLIGLWALSAKKQAIP